MYSSYQKFLCATMSHNTVVRARYYHLLLELFQVRGDGRELVAVHPSAVKIRAEDGRRVEGVDISPFISKLPYGMAEPLSKTLDSEI